MLQLSVGNRSMSRCATWALGALLMLVSTGCGGTQGKFVWIDQLTPEQKASVQDTYVIGVNDQLTVLVFGHPEMSGRNRVRADGNVSVGLLGDVLATGKTPVSLAREIEAQLVAKNLAVGARVTIVLEESAPIRISLIGEVSRPGLYSLEAGAGLSEAIAIGGGFTAFAHRDRLFIIRRSPELIRIRFTYADLASARGEAAVFRLRTGDTILVE